MNLFPGYITGEVRNSSYGVSLSCCHARVNHWNVFYLSIIYVFFHFKDLFGLSEPLIVRIVESVCTIEETKYRLKFHMNELILPEPTPVASIEISRLRV